MRILYSVFAGHREQWELVQDDHIFVESASQIDRLRHARTPWRVYRVGNVSVLRVFHLET